MEVGRVCYESASAAAAEARRRRVDAWAAEMGGLGLEVARDLAKRFDQSLEMDPYLTEGEQEDAFAQVAPHLGITDIRRLSDLPDRLPVFPAAARDVMQLASESETGIDDLERCAKSDPVLAGAVIAAANSGLLGPREPLTSLSRALMHLGSDRGRNVLMAAALRGVFKHPRYRELWRHSLDTAATAAWLAAMSGEVAAGEGFLAGLVHDVGRLALLLAPAAANARAERLTAAGCPLAAVERAVFGIAHGPLGAEILNAWRFDSQLQDAVRFHHAPERTESIYAALIYAAEFRNESGEDIPSLARLRSAAGALRLEIEAVTAVSYDAEHIYGALE